MIASSHPVSYASDRRIASKSRSESSATTERQHAEMVLRCAELLELYTRYQLTVDRVENAVRELSDARQAVQSDVNHLGDDYELKRDAYETAPCL